MNYMKMTALAAVLMLCTACATVTVLPNGGSKVSSKPTYESSYSYFLWGLVGEHQLNVSDICNGKSPRQLQTQFTFLDGFLSTITLGIYSPKSAKVWCKQ